MVLFAQGCGSGDDETATAGGGAGAGAMNGSPAGGSGGSATSEAGAGGAPVGPGGANGGGAAGAGGGAAGAGSGAAGSGGAPEQPAIIPDGDPIDAPDLQWTWVDIPDSRCRDGSPTGIGINPSSASTKVMIFLEGGGACFNGTTCLANPSSADGQGFSGRGGGVFDRANPDNPVADWNFVFVPYCTGDVHAGNNPGGDPGTGPQQFVGYENMKLFLNRIVPTFPDATQVLHTGVSAGGFGAALTADLVQRYFGPDVPVTLIDDSGPPMSSEFIPTCLQRQWRELWGFDSGPLADCGSACPNPDDYALDLAEFLATKYSGRKAGLISSLADNIIRLFYGFGNNNCNPGFLPNMPPAQFQQGLEDFRARMQASHPDFGTYYIPGDQHTWIGGGSFYTTTVDGVRLVDWFRDIVEGTSAGHVAP